MTIMERGVMVRGHSFSYPPPVDWRRVTELPQPVAVAWVREEFGDTNFIHSDASGGCFINKTAVIIRGIDHEDARWMSDFRVQALYNHDGRYFLLEERV